MLISSYLLILLVLSILFFVSNNKIFRALNFFTWLFLVIISAANTYNNDTTIYMNIFKSAKNELWIKDVGFGYWMSFANSHNFTYQMVRFLEYLVSFLFIHFGVKKYIGKYEWILLFLYFLFPFLMDVIEVRNFIFESILIFSLPLLASRKKTNYLAFFLLYCAACLIHKIGLIYLPAFLLFLISTEKKSVQKVFVTLFISAAVIGLFRKQLSSILMSSSSALLQIQGISRNLEINNNNGWIVDYVITGAFFLGSLFNYQVALLKHKQNQNYLFDVRYRLQKLIFVLSFYGALFLPFYAISGDYMRIIRNLYLLNYFSIIITFTLPGSNLVFKTKKSNYSIALVALMIFTSLASVVYGGNFDSWFGEIFRNNFIFSF